METYGKLTLVKDVSSGDSHSVLDQHLHAWALWMMSAGMSSRTVNARCELIALFARRLNVDPVTAGWEPLAEFLADARFSPGTRQTYTAHFRTWYHWLVLMDIRVDDPTLKLHKSRAVRRKPRPISTAQLGTILRTRMHARTAAMVLLGAYEGFRVHEIAKFAGSDISGETVAVLGKGAVYDELPLHPLVAEVAKAMPKAGLWFPSHTRGGAVLPNSVSAIVGQLMRRADIPPTRTAHSLRHFFGTEALRATGNLAVVQQLMRHANIASTVAYTLVDLEERRAAVLALPVPVRLRAVA